ncbi:DUF2290 domain-containing protein [Peribacillus psychrosaccharolyticus]|uniref:DUF2290 domain-containing protein n=1 Tax=Peribacillus psychrosaccharolyticus TaxID=1407 RepID=UPI003D2DA193
MPIRFDFDPHNAKEGHPASHLHISKEDCRIQCIPHLVWVTSLSLFSQIFTVTYIINIPFLRNGLANI